MPLSTYATEHDLAVWLSTRLDAGIAALLGWTVGSSAPGSYQEAVNQALRLYGLHSGQTITDASDAATLEAAARLAMWEQVNDLLPSYITQGTPDGMTFNLAEMVTNAGNQLKRARVAALRAGLGYSVEQRAIVNVYDFYSPIPDSERVLP